MFTPWESLEEQPTWYCERVTFPAEAKEPQQPAYPFSCDWAQSLNLLEEYPAWFRSEVKQFPGLIEDDALVLRIQDLVSAELGGHAARQTRKEAEREAELGRSWAAESARMQAEALAWGGLPRRTDAETEDEGKKGKDRGGGS